MYIYTDLFIFREILVTGWKKYAGNPAKLNPKPCTLTNQFKVVPPQSEVGEETHSL